MADGHVDRLSMVQAQAKATKGLLGGKKGGIKGLLGKGDQLTQLAAQRESDSIKFTNHLMKQNLVKDLEATLQTALQESPDLKGNFFAGIISDDQYRVEVVPLETAVNAVSDASTEEARDALSKTPMGYFSKKDFTLKTPDDPKYKAFRDRLNSFFQRNKSVIAYLQNNDAQLPKL